MSRFSRTVFAAILAIALIVVLCPVATADGHMTLTILHTNDTHARIEPFTPYGEPTQGGVARRYSAIQQVRAEAKNVLLVDAGDAFQGTLFFNKWQGEEASHFMNALGYDAMVIGNHEFDSGPGTLGSFVRAADFPVLGSNVDVTNEPELNGNVKATHIMTVGGMRVGMFGLTTPETSYISSPGANVTFKDPIETAKAMVKAIENQGVNIIVALTHQGYKEDLALAKAVDGIDVIVGGHSHTLLGSSEDAAGAYPTVAQSPNGGTVLVVSAQDWGRYLGRLDVTFSADGKVASYGGAPIYMDESIPEDADIAAQVAKYAQPINALKTLLVGSSAVDLEGTRNLVRTQETNLGNLITDAMLWATKAQGIEVAVTNGGGIRASIPAGEVTMGQVLEVLPFGNAISTFELKGEDLWAALENGVAKVEDAKGQFPQVAGLRFNYDPTKAVGSRVTHVEIENADGSYTPISLTATYKVASNDFMRAGGDGYTVLAEKAMNAYDGGAVLADATADYIKAMSPVNPEVEGRITAGASSDYDAAAPVESAAAAVEAEVEPIHASGILAGNAGGAYQSHKVAYTTATDAVVTVRYAPDNPVIAKTFGFRVYGPKGKVADGVFQGTHGARTAEFPADAGVEYTVQVYNYLPGAAIGYSIVK